jgi:hypothetical protein
MSAEREDFDSLAGMIEVRLRARAMARLRSGTTDAADGYMAAVLLRERKQFVDALFQIFHTLHGPDPEPLRKPEPEPEEALPEGFKLQPTPEILDKAQKLQALAVASPSENERNAAWLQFEKLWKKYKLPNNLGV